MRYFIELSYDGSAYCGWQVQSSSCSVQELLESGLRFKTAFTGRVTGCGRTDAGVHAHQFFAHFDLDKEVDTSKLSDDLNRYLPNDIAIKQIFMVNSNAHARFDAISRTYCYYLATKKNPFMKNYVLPVHYFLNLDMMNEASVVLMKFEDFTSFSKLHSDVKTNNCMVTQAFWRVHDEQLIFTITADRFLRDMVRAIVGTLLDVGRGKISLTQFIDIIQNKDRRKAGISVPAHALFLEKVEYDWDKILTL